MFLTQANFFQFLCLTTISDPPRHYPEPQEIKLKLYQRECEKLQVIPISAYLRQTDNKSLHIKHYNIGPNGAKALAAAILVCVPFCFCCYLISCFWKCKRELLCHFGCCQCIIAPNKGPLK